MASYNNLFKKQQDLGSKQSRKSKPAYPTLGQCKDAVGGNLAIATVFQKLHHYCSKARFEVDGKMYSAPTTKMLVDELGLGRSTVQKALRFLEKQGHIEVVRKHFTRSPRRYVRILGTTANTSVSDEDSESKASASQMDDAASAGEAATASATETVQYKKEKKNNTEIKKSQPFQEEVEAVELGSNSVQVDPIDHSQPATRVNEPKKPQPFTTINRPDLWEPRGLFERGALDRFKSEANREAYRVTERLRKKRAWDMLSCKIWHQRYTARLVREFRRSKQKEINANKCQHP